MYKEASLTPFQRSVLVDKATEHAFSGEYTDTEINGSYLCKMCGLALFRASNKFHSGCGWPSFDVEIAGCVATAPDADGRRSEIICQRCKSHLGHVFHGEGFTPLNTRHCVNSAAIDFITDTQVTDTHEIILAAGCFWGVEYYLQRLPGVLLTQVGYCGGKTENPSYQAVCNKTTGHLEVVRVIYDESKLGLIQLLQYFFEIHDFSQVDGQGPDVGEQYLSAIFYYNQEQLDTATAVIGQLVAKGYNVATTLRPMSTFWVAEAYHQNYYFHKNSLPYCHKHTKIF